MTINLKIIFITFLLPLKLYACEDFVPENNRKVPRSEAILKKLSPETREVLKTHGTLVNEYGELRVEKKNVIRSEGYIIDLSSKLGSGGEGSIFLCQNEVSGSFHAAKHKIFEGKDLYLGDTEYRYNQALGRIDGALTIQQGEKFYSTYLILNLVDGFVFTNVPCHCFGEEPQASEKRALWSYNFLKEIRLVLGKGVWQQDQNWQNAMIDVNDNVYLIDFGDRGRRHDVQITPREESIINARSMEEFCWLGMLRSIWCGDTYWKDFQYNENPWLPFLNHVFGRNPENLTIGTLSETLENRMRELNHPEFRQDKGNM